MIHANGTMDVNFKGEVVTRRFTINETPIGRTYEPETADHELVLHHIAGDMPTVIEIRAPGTPEVYADRSLNAREY